MPSNSSTGQTSGKFTLTRYAELSERPWPSLIFLLPMIAIYEIGSRTHQAQIIASTMLNTFFQLLGGYSRSLPALLVMAVLITWHLAKRDPWKFPPRLLAWMALESIVLGAPLIFISLAVPKYIPLYTGSENGTRAMIVLSMGAGIYEELVFRLIAFTLLSLLLVDALKIRRWVANIAIVLLSAVLFSLYHYLGPETFNLQSFAFRTVAGVYFGLIFIFRGFGITAGCHAAYDIMVVILLTVL